MNTRTRAFAAVNAAISEVTEAARMALNAGKFDDAAWCARLANELSKLSPDQTPVAASPSKNGDANGSSTYEAREETQHVLSNHSKAGGVARFPLPRERRPEVRGYPLFYRDGDTLVKVGWSKSQRGEYEHRAPKAVIDALAREVKRIGVGKPTSMEALLPLRDGSGSELPSYQAYLALAWLRASGAVQRHGQDGYSVTPEFARAGAIEKLWGGLTSTRPHVRLR